MALNSFVGRASSSITPLTVRFTHGAVSALNVENRRVLGGQSLLPSVGFSTLTNNNLGSLIESEPAPNEAITIGKLFPFVIEDEDEDDFCPILDGMRLTSEYQKEKIGVQVDRPIVWKHHPLIIPMKVRIQRGEQYLYFDICARRDQIKIQTFTMRDYNTEHLENFEGILRSKGINSGLINMFCDHLGIKRKNYTKPNP